MLEREILHSLSADQFAFTPLRHGECSNALLSIRLNCIEMLENGYSHVNLLAVDYTKAFDKLPHKSIIKALREEMNVHPSSVRFIESFLTDRRQRVLSSNGRPSNFVSVTSGVPQGSILGPILFAIVLNSFRVKNNASRVIAYADDISVLCPEHNGLHSNVYQEVDNLVTWSTSRGLVINTTKTVCLPLSRRHVSTVPTIMIDGHQIQIVQSTKILGIILDANMKWNSHVNHLMSKCSKSMYIVRNLCKHGCSDDIVVSAFKAFVLCHLTYAWSVLCDVTVAQMSRMLSFEKTLKRLCTSKIDFSTKECLININKRLIKKIVKNYPNHRISNFFVSRPNSSYLLRNSLTILPKFSYSSLSRNSFLKFYKFS